MSASLALAYMSVHGSLEVSAMSLRNQQPLIYVLRVNNASLLWLIIRSYPSNLVQTTQKEIWRSIKHEIHTKQDCSHQLNKTRYTDRHIHILLVDIWSRIFITLVLFHAFLPFSLAHLHSSNLLLNLIRNSCFSCCLIS